MSTPASTIPTNTSSAPTATSAPATTSAATTQPTTTSAPSTSSSSTLPVDPNTSTVSPSPAPATDTKTSNGSGSKTKTSKSYGSGTATISGGPSSSNTPGDNGDNGSNNDTQGGGGSKIIGPVVGSICGVLVLAFIVGVFVMRYRKKSKARKRRLDFLNDHGNASATSAPITSSQHQDSPGIPAAALARPSTPGGGRPSNLGGRPMEMTAVGGGMAGTAHVPNEGYDYQPGYQQQANYGGYQEQYDQNDQYDPYYAQHQGYYPEQQQQYPQQQYQQQQYQQQQYPNQFAPPAVIGGSPAMTHASAAYPPPPPSTITGGHSSPRTPQQSNVNVASYEKNAISETGYTPTHSQSRNPQLVPENEERIKVPV
ncbi:hypothetical protein BGZ80_006457 [Entomortierella chlamydospora]|uniref:Uncharacterized protein n=1 Tax=Entomortierella chlamydospora TaxID=101097 RepID=A0A9P6T1X3_9FUNG|nr:hypothetical protein BGZ79_007534 [Entomortierella chlamydospora]KAG0018987.1 hypothetical protein BGZ80_006457 [Entomortierella chlamydospora]